MRVRLAGSLIVVVCGLLPTLFGGVLFALLMVALGLCGYSEYLALVDRVRVRRDRVLAATGYLAIVAMAVVALTGAGATGLFAVTALAVAAPLIVLLGNPAQTNGLTTWSLACSGALYLALPVYAAITTRALPGQVEAPWMNQWVSSLAVGWDAAPVGLAWALVAILVIWTNDSAAYLVGRVIGQRKLAPEVSPGKTVEGSLGGLVGSALAGGLVFVFVGLGAGWLGAVVGVVIGFAGQLGDLAESLLKRQAGVKDSGSLIPGHGGVLDRIDALLFAFPTTLMLAVSLERLGLT